MFKFSSWSLLKKSLYGLNFISILLIFSASVFALKHLDKQGRSGISQKVLSLTDFVKRASNHAFWNFDVEVLKSFSTQLAADNDIMAVEFFDKTGKNIETVTKQSTAGLPFFEGKVSAPNKAEDVIGTIKIYYSYASIEQELNNLFIGLIIIALIFQGTLSLSMYLFLGRSSKRLELSMGMLKETAEQSRASGATLKDLSASLSKKGATQSAAVEETSATLNELSAILAKTVESSEQAFNMATSSFDYAKKGQSENEALQLAMMQISEGAAKIQEITTVVDDIAFQTNILALNAAVEAARAGEQGKGFAVVADAVRTLAQKSTVAAKDISNLIIESTIRVEKGKNLVKSNLEIFEEILKSAQQVKVINEQLLASSKEQSEGINQITQAMLEIDQVVNESAASTAETATHADSMAQQSEFLNEVVFNFEKEIKGTKAA